MNFLPPVTKKYESKTSENMVIADGWWNHDGCFIFKFGTSKTKNGKLYNVSNIFIFDRINLTPFYCLLL